MTKTYETSLSMQLAALADAEGMTPAQVVKFPELIRAAGLVRNTISSKTIHDADRVLRDWIAQTLVKADKLNGREEEVQEEDQTPRSKPKPKRNGYVRVRIFGHPVTAILRWMGAHDWSFDDAAVALADLGAARTADSTIKIQLRAGKVGDKSRGEVPQLGARHIRQLERARL